MEHRAFIRQSLHLNAQLIRTGVGTQPCTIKNFCPGGLFLALHGAGAMEIGDTVQIRFTAEVDGHKHEFRLRARLAGEYNGGIGCEFFDPDENAIHALQLCAEQPGDHPATVVAVQTGSRLSPQSAQLILSCKEKLSNYLTHQLEDMFKHAAEDLFISARDAANNAQQNIYLDTQKDLGRLKDPVRQGFVDVIVAQMDTLGAPLGASQEPEEDDTSGGLSLVESGEFADWLAVKQINSGAESGVREEQYKIQKRLEVLLDRGLDEDNNPLGLAVLCHTFHDAIQTIQTPRLARRIVFESFDKTVVGNLNGFYTELNAFLAGAGIATNLEMPKPVVPKTQEAAPKPATAVLNSEFPDQFADSSSTPANTPPSASAHLGSSADSARHGHPGAGSQSIPTLSSASTPSVGPGPISEGARSGFARSQATQTSNLTDRRGPSSVVGSADDHAAFIEGLGLGAEFQETFDSSISGVTDEMAPHPSLLTDVPFDPQRIISGNVYSSPLDITHSAYLTAQTLLHLSRHVQPDDSQNESLPSYAPEQVRGALSLLQTQEATQPTTGSSRVDLKTRVVRALRSRHGYAEKKDIPEEQQATIELIAQLIESVVTDSLVASDLEPQLRRLEVPLLAVAMQDPSFFATPDHPARQVVNRIAQIAGAKDGSLADGIAHSIDAVMQRIVSHAGEDPDIFAESIRNLDSVLAQQSEIRQTNLREVARHCDQQQSLVKTQPLGRTRYRTARTPRDAASVAVTRQTPASRRRGDAGQKHRPPAARCTGMDRGRLFQLCFRRQPGSQNRHHDSQRAGDATASRRHRCHT